MRLIELFSRRATAVNVKAKNKDQVIDKLVDLQVTHGNITDKEAYKKAIYAREEEFSTYVGDGIVVPHARTEVVTRPSLALARLAEPIQYNEDDEDKADLFVMIAAPMNGSLHVDILARMMTLLADEDFVEKLRKAKDEDELLGLLDKAEQEKFGDESFTQEEIASAGYRVLAVTACPTGIAHTYMAAENLQKAGQSLGISIKVETNGSGGAKNILTDEEIAACEGVVIAADKNVEMDRFDGKPVVITRVADGIHKPEELIKRAVSGDAPVYHAKNAGSGSKEPAAKQGFGSTIYKHLMNGISHMLPFVVGGGILIALAFLLDDYSINPSNFGMNTPVAAVFKTIGGVSFGFMLPVLAGFIAMSIADRPGLVVGFVGGAIAASGDSFVSLLGNGDPVSGGFLAALLAGFVGGYFVLLLKKATDKMPKAMDGLRPMLIYPLVGILFIGAFMFLINPVMGAINTWIANLLNSMGGSSKILLGAVLGGMMSVDMGGPINKAAYVFGVAALGSGQYDVMAAVMVGGMVPPIVIALSATFFPKKWTKDERNNGFVNYIMGLCFITEGTIPYAAADPIRVIPSCVVGSAIAGALSMLFGCTLMAPHGGVFVFPTVGNPLMYLLALVVGSVVGAVMLSLLKKNKQ
ncbi:MAG: PTS sugar transporter subunit IIA [Oscillospiraceae bacterium]|nr:PTS sugar transporter subunit IIA [Oscillospiraceae bacterium]MBQ2158216.1 PTS sugar transporter subunit IIA [Oscillospiraceae bacterium]MBQ2231758.1 PTS sugar transporter subunit IIA [Oscillospiraceae bacterium]MBQ3951801.1 PTS sugar transporter subunit IIA [Oscillospiraceae bacterium]